MMLAAGKHRLEVKEKKSKKERKVARAERVLARYQEVHGPLTHETPEPVLQLARLVAHDRALLDNPHYEYWLKTGTGHTDSPAPKKTARSSPRAADGLSGRYHAGHCHSPKASTDNHHPQRIPPQPSAKNIRTRPSDGKPTGTPFDYEEYETRKADRVAADPEKVQREKAAKRRDREKFWFNYTETNQFDRCNEALKESSLSIGADNAEQRRLARFLDIWSSVITACAAEKIDRLHLRQEDRIANVKNRGRVRGAGRAARLAGF